MQIFPFLIDFQVKFSQFNVLYLELDVVSATDYFLKYSYLSQHEIQKWKSIHQHCQCSSYYEATMM